MISFITHETQQSYTKFFEFILFDHLFATGLTLQGVPKKVNNKKNNNNGNNDNDNNEYKN